MKLTKEYLLTQVAAVQYEFHGTATICIVDTKAGIKLTGTSGCLDPANYNREIGKTVAFENAVEQLWALEGYFFAKAWVADAAVTAERAEEVLLKHISLCLDTFK